MRYLPVNHDGSNVDSARDEGISHVDPLIQPRASEICIDKLRWETVSGVLTIEIAQTLTELFPAPVAPMILQMLSETSRRAETNLRDNDIRLSSLHQVRVGDLRVLRHFRSRGFGMVGRVCLENCPRCQGGG